MRAWESAKDGMASQHAKTVSANRVPNLRVGMRYLPRLPLTSLEHLSDHLVVNKSSKATKRRYADYGLADSARSAILWARARTGLITVESLAIRCKMGTTAGNSCRLFPLAASSMRFNSSSR